MRTGGNGVETGRVRESREGCDEEEVGGGKGRRGYSDKAEGSAGCVEFLGIKGDFCNITNCGRGKWRKSLDVSGVEGDSAELPS